MVVSGYLSNSTLERQPRMTDLLGLPVALPKKNAAGTLCSGRVELAYRGIMPRVAD